MTRRRDPFQMALVTLRDLAQGGAFAPGSPIVIVEEARRLRLSTTPVREALAWLSGEGLIERAPSGGYLAPRMDVAIVRDRFAFRLQCLTMSLDLTAELQDRRIATATTDDLDPRPIERFDRIVRSVGNAVLADAFDRVGRQLHRLALAERKVLADVDGEALAVCRVLDEARVPEMREVLEAYHQRRIEAAGLLVLETETDRPLPEDGAI